MAGNDACGLIKGVEPLLDGAFNGRRVPSPEISSTDASPEERISRKQQLF